MVNRGNNTKNSLRIIFYITGCKGNEKVERINNFLRESNIEIDYENSYAYSDSKSDLPMLSLVKNSFLVNKKDGTVIEELNKNTVFFSLKKKSLFPTTIF